MKIKSYIKDLKEEDVEKVIDVLVQNIEAYGDFSIADVLGIHFYGFYNEEDSLMGFFALQDWSHKEKCICYVYVYEEYRRQGLFNKMIKFAKEKYYNYIYFTIGAALKNELANEIYSRKFEKFKTDEVGNWYLILDRTAK